MNRIDHYKVEADKLVPRFMQFGGPASTLRAYQHWHPYAAIYSVTYRGRTVWMTSKQHAIWHECQKYWKRGKRDTLERIATQVGCSRASVSRFLRRLDLWRFIDLVTVRGRHGGTYIFTRHDPYNEKPRRWTMSLRDQWRARMRAQAAAALEPLREAYRRKKGKLPVYPHWWETALQGAFLTGSTDATYWRVIETPRRRYR